VSKELILSVKNVENFILNLNGEKLESFVPMSVKINGCLLIGKLITPNS
jgi:hypothetical protein